MRRQLLCGLLIVLTAALSGCGWIPIYMNPQGYSASYRDAMLHSDQYGVVSTNMMTPRPQRTMRPKRRGWSFVPGTSSEMQVRARDVQRQAVVSPDELKVRR